MSRHFSRHSLNLLVVITAITAYGAVGEDEMHDAPSPASVSMAATLLGSISFIMCLYYFTNWPDPDIKKYSWEIISSTISIFCAVLLFQSFNDLIEAYIIEKYHLDHLGTLIADMSHMLIWFTLLQVALAWFSGAITVDYEQIKNNKEELEENLEARELNMKCYAALMAHLTGFASINAWGSLQQLPFFARGPHMAMSAVVVAFFGMCILQRLTAKIRENVCLGDDGEKDPFEEMWDDETEEAENDIFALTISFMTVNALRFMIIGCMPNNEGKEEAPQCPDEGLYEHSNVDKLFMWASGGVFTSMVFLMHYYFPETWDTTHLPVPPAFAKRMAFDTMAGVSMCFSWCSFYSVQMILAGFVLFKGEDNAEMMSVVVALVCSLGVFGLMLPLDWLADQEFTGDRCDQGIRAMMDAFALLVGFSWEQCFDTSVDALARSTPDPHISKLLLSFVCAGLLVPAWKWYMLPYILKKGWRFDLVMRPADLETVFTQMMDEEIEKEQEEEKTSLKEGKQGRGKEGKELRQTVKILQKLGQKSAVDGECVLGYVPPKNPLVQSSNVDELQQQVRELRAALAKAERERDVAQHMAAYQMESVLENMKRLNLTVTRIP